jgi:hypothetical protein
VTGHHADASVHLHNSVVTAGFFVLIFVFYNHVFVKEMKILCFSVLLALVFKAVSV